MFPAEKALSSILFAREERGSLRKLSVTNDAKTDFSSNDYLGFARSALLHQMAAEKEAKVNVSNGSGGSRLLTGNTSVAERLESFLANKHNTEAALVFNSGYDANVGLFSCVPAKEDTIIYDELVHASIHDGIRLSRASSFPFRHSDVAHLEERLKSSKGNVYVAVESVYSMDGDTAPLKQIADLCAQYNANFIVDEAHATGVFGMGLVLQLKLTDKVFARIHTFGKALGCHGAAIVGSKVLKEYLVNYARSFIYTTALPVHSLLTIESAYELLENSDAVVKKLSDNIDHFKRKINKEDGWMESSSAVQSLLVSGNENVKKLSLAIQKQGMDVRPIMSPTVPKGKERIRVCLHSYNTHAEMDKLLEVIHKELK
jgi:8-amino-7-oxononanoate synthase